MITRIITAIIALALLVPFLIFSHTFMFLIFAGALSVFGVYEMLHCMGLHKKPFAAIPSYLFALTVALLTRLGGFDNKQYFMLVGILAFLYIFILLVVAVFSKGAFAVNEVALLACMAIYISVGFSSIVRIRDVAGGGYAFLLVFLASWITDVFAYFFGCRFGKHKLIPDVSPKKSVEGAVAGVVFCTLFFLLYGFVIQYFFDVQANYLALALIGLLSSFISQAGDLIASLVKRQYGIKDYGNIFPGHGGFLDRFDSVIAVSSVMYIAMVTTSFFEMFTVLA